MRVAVWHNLPWGGGFRVLGDQVAGLVAAGHEVRVWAPPTAAVLDGVRASVVPLAQPGAQRWRDEVLSAWRGRDPELTALEEHSARCAASIDAFAPDVVLAHPGASYRPPAIAAYVAAPAVLYMHEPNRTLFEATSDHPWSAEMDTRRPGPIALRQFVGELVRLERFRVEVRTETRWVAAFDRVLVNSSFTREAALRAYGIPARVCRPGIDESRFVGVSRPRELRGSVLFVGALVREKNPQFLLDALVAAGSRVERVVWVANHVDGLTRAQFDRTVERTGLRVELRQAVSDEELLRCYAEADVFVYAPRLEPLGLAPLEANATGLPVVAVAEGGVRETVIDGVNGLVAEPDPFAFGARVAELLEDPDRTRELGDSARNHVHAHWNVQDAISRLEQYLESVVSTHAADGLDGHR